MAKRYKYSVTGNRGGKYLTETLAEAKKIAGKHGTVRELTRHYKYSVRGPRGGEYLCSTLREAKKLAGKTGSVRKLRSATPRAGGRTKRKSKRNPGFSDNTPPARVKDEAKRLGAAGRRKGLHAPAQDQAFMSFAFRGAGKGYKFVTLAKAYNKGWQEAHHEVTQPEADRLLGRKRNPRAIKGYVEQDSVDGNWGFTVEDPIAKDRYQLQVGGWSSETAAQGALDDFIQGSGIYPSQTLQQYAKIFLAHEKTHGWRIGRRRNPQMLITKAIARRLPALYATENIKDPVVHLKLFNAFGGGTWLITEYDPKQDLAFGFVAGLGGQGDDELGYISIAELRKLRKWGAPRIERDRWFRPAPLSIAKAREAYLRGEGPKPAEKKPRKPAPKRATKRRTKAVPKLKTKAPKGTQGALFANPVSGTSLRYQAARERETASFYSDLWGEQDWGGLQEAGVLTPGDVQKLSDWRHLSPSSPELTSIHQKITEAINEANREATALEDAADDYDDEYDEYGNKYSHRNPKRNPVNVPMVRSIAKDIGRTYGTRFSVRKGHGQTLGLVEVRDGRDESPANAQIALLKALKADGYEATGGGMTLAEKIRQIQQYGAVALSLELTHRPTIPDDVLHLWDDEIT